MNHLYVCHFSNGHIKVGRSIDPQSRIASHEARVSCLGVELVESSVFECVAGSAGPEAALIQKCREHASANHKSEWFAGLDFDDVCEWAREFSATRHEDDKPEWAKSALTPEQRRDVAAKVGVHEQYLYQCLTGRRDMNPAEARRVETETGGLVTRKMLCQKTWAGIWPELAEQSCAESTTTEA